MTRYADRLTGLIFGEQVLNWNGDRDDNPSGINCGSTCSKSFARGKIGTLTATVRDSFGAQTSQQTSIIIS